MASENQPHMEQEQEGSLKLLGSWASSYTHRVQLALKLKAIEFDYVEEDLSNKSPTLLLHNPIYKKVPVLVHRNRPIPESLVILQYLDEAWPSTYPILPADPYETALVRFWSYFAEDKLGPAVAVVFTSSGEEQQAAVLQVHEHLKQIENELRDGAFKGRKFFGGERIGLLDIVLGCGSYWLPVFEEVAKVKLVDPKSFPLFNAWLKVFEEEEEVKAIIPALDRLIEYATAVRHVMLSTKEGRSDVSGSSNGTEIEEDAGGPICYLLGEEKRVIGGLISRV